MTDTDRIEEHSCLLESQHGYEQEEAVPLSDAEIEQAISEEEFSAAAAGRPAIHRVYQAKAATRRDRSNAQIDQLVIHTPEGYEGGTLSVLQNGRAGFDWYLPPSGRLYKCNAFSKYVAWQAGYWHSNLRSIGIEQWDFAANMGNAPDTHYRRLAALIAWLTQLLDIPIRHAGWNEPGLVAHAQITPKSRTDPGRNFDWDKLIRYVKEEQGQDGSAPAPSQPTKGVEEQEAEYRRVNTLAIGKKNQQVGKAAVDALNEVGLARENKTLFARRIEPAGAIRYVSRMSAEAAKGQVISIVIGTQAKPYLSPKVDVIGTLEDTDILDCMGDSMSHTVDMVSWRLSAIADYLGFSSGYEDSEKDKLLAAYGRDTRNLT